MVLPALISGFNRTENFCYMEVKGVTLKSTAWRNFPMLTRTGSTSSRRIATAASEGFGAYVLFCDTNERRQSLYSFLPNEIGSSGEALPLLHLTALRFLAYDTKVTPEHIVLDQSVPVVLPGWRKNMTRIEFGYGKKGKSSRYPRKESDRLFCVQDP